MYRWHGKQMNHFHQICLRNILHIRWQDKVSETEVLKQADIPSVVTIMRMAQLIWAGHVSRQAEQKRATRKARAISTSTTAPNHFCPTCGRGFFAWIVLISHLRTHKTSSTAN
ncbi:hypothetical protein ACOMHN_036475 [Nucella lapillus]